MPDPDIRPEGTDAVGVPDRPAPQPIRLADYRPPPFLIDRVDLRFELDLVGVRVHSTLALRRNPAAAAVDDDLVLDGQGLELLRIAVDGDELAAGSYEVTAERLRVHAVPAGFELQTTVRIHPETNTALEGLYASGDGYCTQCEAEGFRRITWFLDRPDVLSRYTTTIEADKERFPTLLANGNPIAQGDLPSGRHFVTWEDPHKKPCYLFALVAGDLRFIEEHYRTIEGRDVTLRIYTSEKNIDKCDHALRSLIRAMQWDEKVYGLACDLDHYSIVVTDDFNMGAMENKGLNIFNSKYVLARPDTASDADFVAIEGVIGHEYFHNWTGNRVTCRDWFQLSLKEGLTVFRDQQFSADQGSAAVKRIQDVRALQTLQFPEDAGPMAHPVRPASVIEINNFYTVTVYEKGAEVVRMYHTLLGADGFRRGMDLYFERFDGQAVTCDDFRRAMADANGRDLDQFERWYSQAGTPTVHVTTEHDPVAHTFTLHLRQSCPATPGLDNDLPFHIPFSVGLLTAGGEELPLRRADRPTAGAVTTAVLELTDREQSFTFLEVPAPPIPSLLRGFSAPVKLDHDSTPEALALLLAHDTDPLSRWRANQELMLGVMTGLLAAYGEGRPLLVDDRIVTAFRRVLEAGAADLAVGDGAALGAELLLLPSESYLGDQQATDDVDAVHHVRELVRRQLAEQLREPLLATYRRCRSISATNPYDLAPASIARRSLQGACIGLLMCLDDDEVLAACQEQRQAAGNMTESIGALVNLCHHDAPGAVAALADFYQRWRGDPLVVDKWLAIQATSPMPDTLATVRRLLEHEAFSIRNPNKVRALIGAFCGQNRLRFHDRSGAGYEFLAEQILHLDSINPQVAARLTGMLQRWRRFDARRQEAMRAQLERITRAPGLSRDVFEIAMKSLA